MHNEGTVAARVAAVNGAYLGIWGDFLRNRRRQAAERAELFLGVLASLPPSAKDADVWVAEADFLYIAGAVAGNDAGRLERAVAAYERSLASPGGGANASARRMAAEALLRLRRYEDAFDAFAALASGPRSTAWGDLEAPPFRLRHDAFLCERLGRLGRLPVTSAAEAAAALHAVAARVDDRGSCDGPGGGHRDNRRRWPLASEFSEDLQRGLFDELLTVSTPYPSAGLASWDAGGGADPLSNAVDWSRVEAEYLDRSVVTIDGFFNEAALAELWRYAREAPIFRTVRNGFLGAFPADGHVHPATLATARSLERRLPRVFAGHPLGLWWLFKYTEAAPRGIGLHADAAAVNLNIWLTPDSARKSGGGLDVYTQVPPDDAAVGDFNREFASDAEEESLRDELRSAGPVERVDYRCNRATLFVSDLWHESQPFEFVNSVEEPRVNLTLLFGDRTDGRCASKKVAGPSASDANGVAPKQTEEGWDLFG